MLDVARSVAGRRVAAMPMAEPSQLEQRIRAVLDPAIRRRSRRAAGIVVTLAILAAAPILAALTPAGTVPRPRSIEPDLLGDAVASPFSERVQPPVPVRRVEASGPDAPLIAMMTDAAARQPRTEIDFVAERARWALSRAHNGQLVAPLLESLGDPDWRIRAYAAWALGHSGDGRATAPLAALLAEPVWRVRAIAAHALATLGDPAAEQAMLAVIGDPAWQVRSGVVRYLAAIGGHRAVIEALCADRHMAVRWIAEESLGGH
ncbi:MAG: HEAT repeat domain-containing protein [Acidobacteriota bacterium]